MDSRASNWEHCLEYAQISDVGMRRANNQDSLAVALASDQQQWLERGHLFVVADGMGAHAAGELASKMATDNVPLNFYKHTELPAPQALARAVQDANDLIHRRGQSSEDFKGMGTTNTNLLLLPQGAVVAHVGDSRAYRLRGNILDQITFDHSLVWEMRVSGQIPADQVPNYIPKNIITRSLGPNPEVQVDLEGPFPLAIGDTFLICSDGLSGQVQDKEMGAILTALPPQQAARLLVDLANLRGGPDNITMIIVRVTAPLAAKGQAAPAMGKTRGKSAPAQPLWWILAGVFGLAGLLLAGLGHLWEGVGGLALGGLLALVALVQRVSAAGGREPELTAEAPLGRGPYVRHNATPDAEVVDAMGQIIHELRDAAKQENWKVDWDSFSRLSQAGTAARESQNYVEALGHFGEAISFMMDQLRKQRPGHGRTTLIE